MKLSNFVADFIASISPRVYGVVGAGAMHLNDAICHHPGIKFIAMHHEQAAAMAAEADARVTNKIGVVHVTAGPGGTNAITGVAGAYVDSIPMLVIAGQCTLATLPDAYGMRQFGTNGLPMVEMMYPITKHSVRIDDPGRIRYELERVVHLATSGRKGPVFVEIPLDVQAAEIDAEKLKGFTPLGSFTPVANPVARVIDALKVAQRPLIIAGNGIHLAGAEASFRALLSLWGIPVVTSWNGIDLLDSNDPLFVGRPGVMGDRAGNFAVQSADVILVLGSRLSVPQTGHDQKAFAPQAKKIIVDIDLAELNKPVAVSAHNIQMDAGIFIDTMLMLSTEVPSYVAWRAQCLSWKQSYPVMIPEYRDSKDGVNAYAFIEELGKHLADDAIVVTDVGAAYIATHQSLKLTGRQRLFHSGGVSAMGVGIPMAIGAKLAGGNRQVVCLVGDGGAMVNIQELETIARLGLDIKIFVFCNDGYMTMQHTQKTHFGRVSASSAATGFKCVAFSLVAEDMGICAGNFDDSKQLPYLWKMFDEWPRLLCSIHLPHNQILAPRLMSKLNDKGEFILPEFDDMWPHLPPEELVLARHHNAVMEAAE